MPTLLDKPVGESASPRRGQGRMIRTGCVCGLALALLAEIARILIGPNFHEVVPGAIYRSAQPSPESLAQMVKQHGIRTVVNLRGVSEPTPWYLDECRATSALDVSQEDLPFSAGRLPPVPVIRRLVEVIDRSEYPILFHCFHGIDRTGMAVMVALLLHTDASLAQAREQLGARHCHLPVGRTGQIDRFFDLYEDWLTSKGLTHSRAAFRQWIVNEYCPGECRCRITMLEPSQLNDVPVGKPVGLRVRAENTSVQPWQMRPGVNAGIHCHCVLHNDAIGFSWVGHAGLFNAAVPPGESVDLTVALPPLKQPGKYRLQLDMNDPQHAFFHQMGGDPFYFDLEVK